MKDESIVIVILFILCGLELLVIIIQFYVTYHLMKLLEKANWINKNTKS